MILDYVIVEFRGWVTAKSAALSFCFLELLGMMNAESQKLAESEQFHWRIDCIHKWKLATSRSSCLARVTSLRQPNYVDRPHGTRLAGTPFTFTDLVLSCFLDMHHHSATWPWSHVVHVVYNLLAERWAILATHLTVIRYSSDVRLLAFRRMAAVFAMLK